MKKCVRLLDRAAYSCYTCSVTKGFFPTTMKQIIIHERGPYRYVDCGYCENGSPDFRLFERDEYSTRYREVYLFDNQAQMLLAIEDYDYTLWLTGKPCYIRDVVAAPIHSCLS